MHLHLNPLGGLAGDMFCAALLDAYPELLSVAQRALAVAPMPRKVRIALVAAGAPLSGKRFQVRLQDSESGSEPHPHTGFRHISSLLQATELNSGVRDRALAIFSLLAVAEARVHGVDPEDVHFHEVGAWDSIADILSAAALLEALAVTSASCAPLPLGTGHVSSAHGLLPVPAPATALLLEGLSVSYDGIAGERVTPTGAAILQSLRPQQAIPAGAVLKASGMGFGTRRLPGIPNCVQILCLATDVAGDGFRTDRVEQLRFEVDDQTPEDLALGLERLRATEGVLSVTTVQAIGKKGRPTMAVEILAMPERLAAVAEVCFRETTTIGFRHQGVDRLTLGRDQRVATVAGREIGVKVVRRPQGATAKAEAADLAGVDGWQERERLRREASELVSRPDGPSEEEPGDG